MNIPENQIGDYFEAIRAASSKINGVRSDGTYTTSEPLTPEEAAAAEAAVAAWDTSDAAQAARDAAKVKALAVANVDAPDAAGQAAAEGLKMLTEAVQWNAKVTDVLIGLIVSGADPATFAGAVAQLSSLTTQPVKDAGVALGLSFPFAAIPFAAAKEIAKARIEAGE